MSEKKKDLKPGYFNQKPLLKVISDMKLSVGLQDSCIQTNQAAILHLEDSATQSEDHEEFIRELCLKHKISLGTRDMGFFKSIQYKAYILQTYNLLEPFFKELNKTYRLYNNFQGKWKTKKDDKSLDPFNQLLENIEPELKAKIKSYPEYYLLNYYRLVRNSIVHLQRDEKEHEKTSKYFSDFIEDNKVYFRDTYEIDAPNEPDEISFYDFMLYTRIIKYFGNILNDTIFPEIKVLVEFAMQNDELNENLLQSKNLNYKGALLKRINTLRSFFHKHFNTAHKELREEFCKEYLDKEGTDSSKYL